MLQGCGSSGGARRTVLADYNLDEFPTGYQSFFPRSISAHPGDTIVFRQSWTGDPHTVTLGTLVNRAVTPLLPYLKGEKPVPKEVPAGALDGFDALPQFFGEDINQLAAQPCYLASGPLPAPTKPCKKQNQHETAFHGTETFFNSGFIPYAGNNGNRFSVKLASDIKPGEYSFNCLVHGPAMSGSIVVKPRSVSVPRPSADNAAASRQLDQFRKEVTALHTATENARPSGADIVAGAASGAGLDSYDNREFFPSTYHARVGQKVTWFVSSQPSHTVSFHVPKYVPVIIVDKNGVVRGNPLTSDPQHSPALPDTGQGPGETPAALHIDAGNYDGSQFLSSGANFFGPLYYSITFTKPGTYNYACLLHPRMIAKVIVG